MRDAGQARERVSSRAPALPVSKTVAVWDVPLRVWHWALAAFVLIACVTPNTHDALHRTAGYAVIGLLAFRLIWGVIGTRHSLLARISLKLRAAPRYMINIFRGETGRYIGLNPAGAAMLVAMVGLLLISTISGVMQISLRFFGVGWIQEVHSLSSNAVMALIGIHLLGTLWMSVLQKENLARAMLTGRKRMPGSTPAARPAGSAKESADVGSAEQVSMVPELPPHRGNPQVAGVKPSPRMPRALSTYDRKLGLG
ncbi:cytochrome b [Bradyrhizobium sp. USDA 4369]